jgi:predicted  nucleic acid-binding Zn-ribbon protein
MATKLDPKIEQALKKLQAANAAAKKSVAATTAAVKKAEQSSQELESEEGK